MADAAGSGPFTVDCSQAVLTQLRQQLQSLEQRHLRQAALDALKDIHQQLLERADECGEPLYNLRHLHGVVRVVAKELVWLHYAVMTETRLAIIKEIRLIFPAPPTAP